MPAEKRHARFDVTAARFARRAIVGRRLDLAEARLVLALAEALPRPPDAIGLLLGRYADTAIARPASR